MSVVLPKIALPSYGPLNKKGLAFRLKCRDYSTNGGIAWSKFFLDLFKYLLRLMSCNSFLCEVSNGSLESVPLLTSVDGGTPNYISDV